MEVELTHDQDVRAGVSGSTYQIPILDPEIASQWHSEDLEGKRGLERQTRIACVYYEMSW